MKCSALSVHHVKSASSRPSTHTSTQWKAVSTKTPGKRITDTVLYIQLFSLFSAGLILSCLFSSTTSENQSLSICVRRFYRLLLPSVQIGFLRFSAISSQPVGDMYFPVVLLFHPIHKCNQSINHAEFWCRAGLSVTAPLFASLRD